ncbi:hypothetical protein DB347_15260 [Opitutaceae bacterium EW11]|nr:hypothetical protein DB347_15260 [Opitutaceae bacterium EW11]
MQQDIHNPWEAIKTPFFPLAFPALYVAPAGADSAALGTLIHINLHGDGGLSVEGQRTTPSTLTVVMSQLVTDRDHTAVEISVPQDAPKSDVEQLMDSCRKAGISRFSLAKRAAEKN